MSELSEIPDRLKNNIKFYHIIYYDYIKGNRFSILFVTNDDKVYGLGDNSWGQLGLGHDYSVKDSQEVMALSHKRIKQFISGNVSYPCYYAVSDENELYSWGWKDCSMKIVN